MTDQLAFAAAKEGEVIDAPKAKDAPVDVLESLEELAWMLSNLAPILDSWEKKDIYVGVSNHREKLERAHRAIAEAKRAR